MTKQERLTLALIAEKEGRYLEVLRLMNPINNNNHLNLPKKKVKRED
jgi:hypothetical protein